MSETSQNLDESMLSTSGGHQLIRRIRFLCGMAVAAMVFWHFGHWAARPVDPRGPITLLLVDQGVVGMAELLGLGVIAGGLAVAICGARSGERGPLAVAIGLATLSLRGGQLDALLLYRMTSLRNNQTAADIFPTWGLIAETWLWLALIAVGFVVGRWIESWFEVPAPRPKAAPGDFFRSGGAIALAGLVAWCTVSYTIGTERTPLLKGQIYFSVTLAFLLGSLVAHWFFQHTPRLWLLLTVAIVATAAYIFGAPGSKALTAAQQAGTYINLRPIARPLPIEFAALGAAGVLLEEDAMLFLRAFFAMPSEEDTPASRAA